MPCDLMPCHLQLPALRPKDLSCNRLAKRHKSVNRAYGGHLAHHVVRERCALVWHLGKGERGQLFHYAAGSGHTWAELWRTGTELEANVSIALNPETQRQCSAIARTCAERIQSSQCQGTALALPLLGAGLAHSLPSGSPCPWLAASST